MYFYPETKSGILNQQAFQQLFDRYFERVRNYIFYRCGDPELATDITLETEYDNDQQVVNTFNNNILKSANQQTRNTTTEARMKLETGWAVNSHHQLEGSLAWVGNRSVWMEDTAGVQFFKQRIRGSHLTLMLQDRMRFGWFKLVPGIRLTHLPYLKQNFLGHSAWASYTLSTAEESFEHFPEDTYLYAPQDQRHELKLAAVLNFEPVYFSASYIYGSGFAIPNYSLRGVTYTRIPYHRVDASFTLKFNLNPAYGEADISILNLFNRENLMYNNLERVPTTQTSSIRIYQQSVPFTPTLYLKIGF